MIRHYIEAVSFCQGECCIAARYRLAAAHNKKILGNTARRPCLPTG
jgi:hypothetical protein